MSNWTPGYGSPDPTPAEPNDTIEIGAGQVPPTVPLEPARRVPAEQPLATTPATTSAAPGSAAPAPVTDTVPGPVPGRAGLRIGTVVFGAVLLVISVVCLLALTTRVRIDGAAIGLALLLGAGAALVAGGAAAAMREARGGPGAGH